ncbi:MAG: radical SAM protein [bacterium]|nr:radical SAM protein [bacterium]
MALSSQRRSQLIERNQRELGERYASLRFLSPQQAKNAEDERAELIGELSRVCQFSCRGAKVDGKNLSPGCAICTQGTWSCLFINGRCNCRCFYCPSPQDEDQVPTTNTVPFSKAGDYVDYLRLMKFAGASLSGGEPLLSLETSVQYISAIKKAFSGAMHTWLYTNGTLATRDALGALQRAGLDEIRFDIGATGLKLDALKNAIGLFKTVTVEIPAIPDDFEAMKDKIREMAACGVNHLNLHQLRLTQHNYPHLVKRNYTYIHGERVTVFESELTALRLIQWARQEEIGLPINYCSFVYKNRFQRAAARKCSADLVCKPHEDVTEAGYIRSLELTGEPEAIRGAIAALEAAGIDQTAWSARPDRLHVSERAWPLLDFSGLHACAAYSEARILPALTYQNPFVTLPLNARRSLFIEKAAVSGRIELNAGERDWLLARPQCVPPSGANVDESRMERLAPYEFVEEGLAPYF